MAQPFHSDALAAAAATFLLETSAPEGFDELTEPQQLVVDLYYGGREIGVAHVTVGPRFIHFDSPLSVLASLPETLDYGTTLSALQRPLEKNSHYVCRSNRQIGCGYLTPSDFAVIYDENRYRLDLFFSPKLLPQKPAINNPYLPAASSQFSMVQNIHSSWSGTESDWGSDSYAAALTGNTIVSFGESALHSQWSIATEQDQQINTLHWSEDYRGRAHSAGLLQPQGGFGYFRPQAAMYGVELRSSQRSRTDISHQHGAPVEINMPVRGRVEIYRDNRLIHSELLEAGNRLLNTSSLPHGAYDIEVRTYDEAGRVLSRHIEFFAKDSLLPAAGEWFWSLQAGLPTRNFSTGTLPDHYDEGVITGSFARRLSTAVGLFASAASSKEQQIFELGGRWVGENFELSPSIVTSDDGRTGYRVQAQMTTPYGTVSALNTRLKSDSTTTSTDLFPLLPGSYSQRNLSFHGALFGGQLSLRFSERDQLKDLLPGNLDTNDQLYEPHRLKTLEFRHPIFKSAHWLGNATLSHSEADGEQYTSLEIQFRVRSKHWQHTANIYGDSSNQYNHGERFAFQSRWHDRDLWASEFEQQLSVEKASDAYYLESRTHLAGHRGYLNATVGVHDNEQGRAVNYLGGFSTNLIATSNSLSWGGERAFESAVIVNIEGSKEQNFEIMVDGSRRGYAKGGKKSVINLPAFRTYDLSLRPLDEGFFDYRERARTITLYPGNVGTTSYKVLSQILVLGRLTSYGEGLGNTDISLGDHSATTDRHGVFQLEVSGTHDKLPFSAITWGSCRMPVDIASSGNKWFNLGTIEQSEAACDSEQITEVIHAGNE
ncbi:TcfC E-set like domain-containing protein [Microbulbifer sp. OS29]|uniref:TcfC E-set like domain-containing protein n=1 Tax=Microbulbifer okhotskensis TaxID=2926617 RepID=A0A9X2ENW2_9GAMM|nr:TcfC E-set like domain-containing protein [Microbulbifer okhotskensis]MCO1335689.1 TcfC E-set like domain-containing protein [Microbulbifer okhotskensis]